MSSKVQFIDISAQYEFLKDKINKRIKDVLSHGQFIMGPEVAKLESKLSEYVGVKHTITCANGTDALSLALMALEIGPGDAVFCPTFTFFATAEAIAHCGATPVFVDVDETTFNICPVDLNRRILDVKAIDTLTAKAIVSVDLFGLPANYTAINSLVSEHGLLLIEDAAQGFGGELNGKRAGSFGDIATTSFFPAKPLGCYGDGGALFTDDDDLAKLLKSLRVHGKGRDKYDNIRIGMNSRLDTLQAAILLEKLDVFPQELIKRNEVANQYPSYLTGTAVLPKVPKGYLSSWAQYTVISENRDEEIKRYKEAGIPTSIYYGKCMHQQSAFKNLGYSERDFPVASRLAGSVYSLPMHPYLDLGRLFHAVV